jgi:hypothetical protein
MTDHSVFAVGTPLLAKGAKALGLDPGERLEARLRVSGSDDVALTADADHTTIRLVEADGPATL